MVTPTAGRVLLVEDDPRIREEVRHSLSKEGFEVTEAERLADARAHLTEEFALVLLDLGLPDGEGLSLCREIRAAGDDTPIVILTARNTNRQRIHGLDAGADDYVVKPFDNEVLLARIRSVLRRAHGTVVEHDLRCGELRLDRQSHQVFRGDKALNLTALEFEFLVFMLQEPGKVWSRRQILEHVWRPNGWPGGPRTVDTMVRRLREKIEPASSDPIYLTTVWGVGYRLTAPEDEA